MSEWIEKVKREITVTQVAASLGLKSRLRAMGPCPACTADRRSRSDGRPPIGLNGRADGWECHACGAKGDAVELACLGVIGSGSNDLDTEGWKQIRQFFTEMGLDLSDAATPRGSRRAPVRTVDSILGGGRPRKRERTQRQPEPPAPEPEPSDGRWRPYTWANGLVPACERALWGETPEAKAARDYLLTVRRLSEDAVREFRLGLYVDPSGEPVVMRGRPVVVIPLIDDTEHPVSAKFRSVPVVGTCEHCDSPRGCTKCRDYRNCKGRPLPLYGAHRLSNDLDMPVIMVEGEMDVLAAHTYGLTANVVSTTSGAGTFTDEWLDLLEPYSSFIGVYDADEKGDEGWAKVAADLGVYRCSRAKLPRKDLGDCLMAGLEAGRIERAIGRAEPMHGIAMRKADDYADPIEILINEPHRLRGVATGWHNVDEIIGGWRPGVVVVSGETGQGKTTFTTAAMLNLARLGAGVMLTSFEQEPIGTVQKLLRNQVGGDFTQVTRATRMDALAALSELDLWILDHYGQITPEKLVETMRYAKRRHGIRYFMVDHLGFLLDPDAPDERRAIQTVMRALAIVAKKMQITIFLIVHPHNTKRDHRGKPVPVTGRDLKGASAIRQDADDILIVSQVPPTKEVPWPRSRIAADKVRSDFAVSGGSCLLAFDPGSTTYADTWEETPAGADGMLVPRR